MHIGEAIHIVNQHLDVKVSSSIQEAWDCIRSKLVEVENTSTNKPSDASSCRIKYCHECGQDIRHEPAHVG